MSDVVAVLGGGHGAHAMAADLTARGFAVNLYEMPRFADRLRSVLKSRTITATGLVEGRFALHAVTCDIEEAIADARFIVVVTPAFAHPAYAELLRGRVSADQLIVLYPGAFGSLVFRAAFGDVDCPTIAEVNNLPYDTRLTGAGEVSVYGHNPVGIGFMPATAAADWGDEVRALHPFARVYEDVLEAGLSIVNPAVHSGPCLLSVTAIENSAKRPFFLYEHGITPASCRLNVQIDNERKAIGRKLGYALTPIEDFTGLREGYTWQELYMSIHGNIALTPIAGPHEITSRYFTEDAPFGLVPWSELGRAAGVATPTIDAILDVYGVLHERDWRSTGRNLASLGVAELSIEELQAYVRTGAVVATGAPGRS